jgi:hypothetical protein
VGLQPPFHSPAVEYLLENVAFVAGPKSSWQSTHVTVKQTVSLIRSLAFQPPPNFDLNTCPIRASNTCPETTSSLLPCTLSHRIPSHQPQVLGDLLSGAGGVCIPRISHLDLFDISLGDTIHELSRTWRALLRIRELHHLVTESCCNLLQCLPSGFTVENPRFSSTLF